MRVIIGCEKSQIITLAFRALGHEAYSCDLQPVSGSHPEWHFQESIFEVLKREKFDLCIFHPPCTDLAVSGARWFKEKIADGRQQQAIDFFMKLANYDCNHIAIENPVGIMSRIWRKPDQIIQPWQFGHPEQKKTCLWLKGLPKLTPTDILPLPECGYWENQTKDGQNRVIVNEHWISYKDPRTAELRSKTYLGVGKAIAEQWSSYLEQQLT